MTLGEIIKDYRTEHAMSMDTFAERSGISKAYISILERNQHPRTGNPVAPSLQCIKQAAKGMNLDFDELFAMMDGEVTLDESKPRHTGVEIPVLGRVAAGIPIEAITDIIDTEEITEDMARRGDYFALQIHGDSMEPRIYDGDVVIVRQQETAENGEIVIVTVNGTDATCKKYHRESDGITLISLNPAYGDMHFTAEQVNELPVKIWGKVVELRGKF